MIPAIGHATPGDRYAAPTTLDRWRCRTLSEAESKPLLAAHGVPVLDERVAPALPTKPRSRPTATRLSGRRQAVRRRHRAQDRAGPRAPRTRRRRRRAQCRDDRPARRGAPDDGDVGVLVAPMVTRQPRADRRAGRRPAVRHDRDARRRRRPRRGGRRRRVPARPDLPHRCRGADRRPRDATAARARSEASRRSTANCWSTCSSGCRTPRTQHPSLAQRRPQPADRRRRSTRRRRRARRGPTT